MKTILLIFCCLALHQSFAQKALDFGEVLGDEADSCPDDWTGIACHPAYPLQIDLEERGTIMPSYEHFMLAFDGSKWMAVHYKGWLRNPHQDSMVLQPVTSFDELFAQLKENRVFTLPDQRTLGLKGSVDDGLLYTISFKAGSKFRRYGMDNPDMYLDLNRDVKELTCYMNIIHLFHNALKPAAH